MPRRAARRPVAAIYFLAAVALVRIAPAHAAPRPAGRAGGDRIAPSLDEISVHVGYQAGFGGQIANPSGFKLFLEYAHRVGRLVWIDLQANQLFGFGSADDTCFDRVGTPFPCDPRLHHYFGGWATEVALGIKLKIPTPIPLVVEIPILGAVDILYNRLCGDSGAAAPLVRFGGGVKYFVHPRIGLGGGTNLSLGPAFHVASGCADSYVDFHGAIDFELGAEFLL